MTEPTRSDTPSASPSPADAGTALYCGIPRCRRFVAYKLISLRGRVRARREAHDIDSSARRGLLECPYHRGPGKKTMTADWNELVAIGRGFFGRAGPLASSSDRMRPLPSETLFAFMGRGILIRGFLGIDEA